jgi:hypothetical protein
MLRFLWRIGSCYVCETLTTQTGILFEFRKGDSGLFICHCKFFSNLWYLTNRKIRQIFTVRSHCQIFTVRFHCQIFTVQIVDYFVHFLLKKIYGLMYLYFTLYDFLQHSVINAARRKYLIQISRRSLFDQSRFRRLHLIDGWCSYLLSILSISTKMWVSCEYYGTKPLFWPLSVNYLEYVEYWSDFITVFEKWIKRKHSLLPDHPQKTRKCIHVNFRECISVNLSPNHHHCSELCLGKNVENMTCVLLSN